MASDTRPFTPKQQLAQQAWEVHRALILAERDIPQLRDNPLWRLQRADAYETYVRCLEQC